MGIIIDVVYELRWEISGRWKKSPNLFGQTIHAKRKTGLFPERISRTFFIYFTKVKTLVYPKISVTIRTIKIKAMVPKTIPKSLPPAGSCSILS